MKTKITPESITTELEPIAIAAVLADKKAKLLAKVNHQDNFALHYSRIAHDAMVEAVSAVIDGPRNARYNAWCDWFNVVCAHKSATNERCQFDTLARQFAAKAYAVLQPKRCKA